MEYSDFLKRQSAAFIEIYQKKFAKTIIAAVLWTVFCFFIIEILSTYSNYDPVSKTHPVSILSFFFLRFSTNEIYSVVDNGKSVFLFFVSVFSLSLVNKVTVKSVLYLLLILVVCFLLDFSFCRLKGQAHHTVSNPHFDMWASEIIFLARLYIPLVLFAVVIQVIVSVEHIKVKQIVFLLIAVFFFNEVAYEVMALLRPAVFELIMSPVKSKATFYFVESALGSLLVASFFLGFHCAMTVPFSLASEQEKE
ncbi:hypothetical protein [Mucilaginibacter sp. R-33]|uniref:hypothetical protein n=1 Tax=Mucilaginibacter sp. R-33 TaxID=3416711 RepID=UPI003CE89337